VANSADRRRAFGLPLASTAAGKEENQRGRERKGMTSESMGVHLSAMHERGSERESSPLDATGSRG
jgi:hypothetical protein